MRIIDPPERTGNLREGDSASEVGARERTTRHASTRPRPLTKRSPLDRFSAALLRHAIHEASHDRPRGTVARLLVVVGLDPHAVLFAVVLDKLHGISLCVLFLLDRHLGAV